MRFPSSVSFSVEGDFLKIFENFDFQKKTIRVLNREIFKNMLFETIQFSNLYKWKEHEHVNIFKYFDF